MTGSLTIIVPPRVCELETKSVRYSRCGSKGTFPHFSEHLSCSITSMLGAKCSRARVVGIRRKSTSSWNCLKGLLWLKVVYMRSWEIYYGLWAPVLYGSTKERHSRPMPFYFVRWYMSLLLFLRATLAFSYLSVSGADLPRRCFQAGGCMKGTFSSATGQGDRWIQCCTVRDTT